MRKLLALLMLAVVGCASAAPSDTDSTIEALYNPQTKFCFENGHFTAAEQTELQRATNLWNAEGVSLAVGARNPPFSKVASTVSACHDLNTVLVVDDVAPVNQMSTYVPSNGVVQAKIILDKDLIADNAWGAGAANMIQLARWEFAMQLGYEIGLGAYPNNNLPGPNVMPGNNGTVGRTPTTPFCLSISDRNLYCQKFGCVGSSLPNTCVGATP